MGYSYQLVPTTAQFVHEVEDLTPEALAAYILGKYPDVAPERPFLQWLVQTPQEHLGKWIPKEAFQYGKPLFNRKETQDSFEPMTPYVVNRRSVGVLMDWYYMDMKEEEAKRQTGTEREPSGTLQWAQERFDCLCDLEKRHSLFILYVS